MTTQEKVDFINNEFVPMLKKARSILKPEGIAGIDEETMVKAGDIINWFPNAHLAFLIDSLEYNVKKSIDEII